MPDRLPQHSSLARKEAPRSFENPHHRQVQVSWKPLSLR